MQQMTSDLQETLSSRSSDQMEAIQSLQNALGRWSGDMTLRAQEPTPPTFPTTKDKCDERLSPMAQQPALRVRSPIPRVQPPSTRVQPSAPRVLLSAVPRVLPPAVPVTQPVANQTQSRQIPRTPEPATTPFKPVAHRPRSQNIHEALTLHPNQASQHKYRSDLIGLWCTPQPPNLAAMSVLY